MSYMNDDCDPFGVPYTKRSNGSYEKVKNYSFNDLKEIAQEERELFQKMDKVKCGEVYREKIIIKLVIE